MVLGLQDQELMKKKKHYKKELDDSHTYLIFMVTDISHGEMMTYSIVQKKLLWNLLLMMELKIHLIDKLFSILILTLLEHVKVTMKFGIKWLLLFSRNEDITI